MKGHGYLRQQDNQNRVWYSISPRLLSMFTLLQTEFSRWGAKAQTHKRRYDTGKSTRGNLTFILLLLLLFLLLDKHKRTPIHTQNTYEHYRVIIRLLIWEVLFHCSRGWDCTPERGSSKHCQVAWFRFDNVKRWLNTNPELVKTTAGHNICIEVTATIQSMDYQEPTVQSGSEASYDASSDEVSRQTRARHFSKKM